MGGVIKRWDDVEGVWKVVGTDRPFFHVSETPPTNPERNSLWVDKSADSVPLTTAHNDLTGLEEGNPHPQYATQQAVDNATDPLVEKAGDTMTGPLLMPDGISSAPALAFSADPDTGLRRSGSNTIFVTTGGSTRLVVDSTGRTYPGSDDGQSLGVSSFRWSDVYAANGTIQTSDGDSKTDVRDTSLGKEFARRARPVEFEFTDGRRPHQGFVAQEIKQLLEDLGVPDSAAYIDPAINAQKRLDAGPPEDVDEDEWRAEVEAELNAPKGLRYSELLPPLYRAFQQQQDEIDDLRTRLEALEAK